ncbi:MAG: hypothetical protein IPK97_08555 [Ahniella sp.]|nr:hypothetical protein [Ahniella sp.]
MDTQVWLARVHHNLKEATWQQLVLCLSLALNLVLAFSALSREIVIHLPPVASADHLMIADAETNQETKNCARALSGRAARQRLREQRRFH